MTVNPKICHFWELYIPDLFDQTHPICLSNNFDSQISCNRLVSDASHAPDGVSYANFLSGKEYGSSNFYYKVKGKLRTLLRNQKFYKISSELIHKFSPDLLHCHFGHTALMLDGLVNNVEKPLVVSFYGVDISSGLANAKFELYLKKLFLRDTLFLVLCREAKSRLLNIGCPEEKIKIWNLPPGIEKFPLRNRNFDGVTRLFMPARFVEKKGHEYLLEALKLLKKDKRKFHLTLYGYGNSALIEKWIENLGLSDVCTLINNRYSVDFNSELRSLLDKNDIFLAPSIRADNGDDEGGPALTMIMAQSAGLPVVCTNFPGSEISMIEGVTGYTCKQRDISSLYRAISKIMDTPEKWKEMGERGHQIVTEGFSMKSQSKKLIDIYHGVLN